MPETYEIDRSDPGYQRRCILPGCPAAFNILDAMEGTPEYQPGWHYAPRMFTGYVCPGHSAAVKAHRPAWVRVNGRVTGCECSCGRWMWLPGTSKTMGEFKQRYVEHVAAEVGRWLARDHGHRCALCGHVWRHNAAVCQCAVCGGFIEFYDSPHGSWWSHVVHPHDEHEAKPVPVAGSRP